jgi:electron transport complex protein RnfE
MTTPTPKPASIWRQGLWDNNPALVQLLGLCPLLAVSNTLVNALGLGIATLLTLMVTNTLASLLRHWLRPEIRIAVFVLIIAGAVTALDLLMAAYRFDLHQRLGIFVPLIVTNCAILARAESFASRQPVWPAFLDGCAQGLGFMLLLAVLGAIREVLGYGSLLRQADSLFGSVAASWTLQFGDQGWSFLLAILPPGAFLILGLLLAGQRYWSARQTQAKTALAQSQGLTGTRADTSLNQL